MYATASDMLRRFGANELISLANSSGRRIGAATLEAIVAGEDTSALDADEVAASAAVEAAINEALQAAESTIESYIGRRYTLPLDPIPTILEQVACDIARYELATDRPTETIIGRYDRRVDWLRRVAKGEISIGVDASDEAPAQGVGPRGKGPARRFTADSLSGQGRGTGTGYDRGIYRA